MFRCSFTARAGGRAEPRDCCGRFVGTTRVIAAHGHEATTRDSAVAVAPLDADTVRRKGCVLRGYLRPARPLGRWPCEPKIVKGPGRPRFRRESGRVGKFCCAGVRHNREESLPGTRKNSCELREAPAPRTLRGFHTVAGRLCACGDHPRRAELFGDTTESQFVSACYMYFRRRTRRTAVRAAPPAAGDSQPLATWHVKAFTLGAEPGRRNWRARGEFTVTTAPDPG